MNHEIAAAWVVNGGIFTALGSIRGNINLTTIGIMMMIMMTIAGLA